MPRPRATALALAALAATVLAACGTASPDPEPAPAPEAVAERTEAPDRAEPPATTTSTVPPSPTVDVSHVTDPAELAAVLAAAGVECADFVDDGPTPEMFGTSSHNGTCTSGTHTLTLSVFPGPGRAVAATELLAMYYDMWKDRYGLETVAWARSGPVLVSAAAPGASGAGLVIGRIGDNDPRPEPEDLAVLETVAAVLGGTVETFSFTD